MENSKLEKGVKEGETCDGTVPSKFCPARFIMFSEFPNPERCLVNILNLVGCYTVCKPRETQLKLGGPAHLLIRQKRIDAPSIDSPFLSGRQPKPEKRGDGDWHICTPDCNLAESCNRQICLVVTPGSRAFESDRVTPGRVCCSISENVEF